MKALTFSYIANGYNLNLTSPIKRTKDINYQVRCLLHYFETTETKCDNVEFGPNLSEQYSSADVVVLASRWNIKRDIETLPLSIPKMLDDGKKVIVVGNSPQSKTFGEKSLNRLDRFIFERKKLPSASQLKGIEERFFEDFVESQTNVNQQLKSIVGELSNAHVVFRDRSDFMCDQEKKRCYMYFPQERIKLLWDYGHTTTDGARVLGRLITKRQWLADFLKS